ncbi:MAG: nitrous oxide reductase accessory protein NosL [Campylobacterales bacterium]|nr:nitrous oxide reductase accessory protein NosL [Campylobacterales bacterium]
MFIKKMIVFLSVILLSFVEVVASQEPSDTVKEKKIYSVGEKIYQKMCNQDIDLKKYLSQDEMKNAIKNDNLCKPLSEQHFEALSLYLWEVKRVSWHVESEKTIVVNKDEKCPVCGMFVYKYPKWVAQIFYEKNHLSFDGVKDLMKHYFKEKQAGEEILVTDYYSQKAIDAKKAYFVLGSDAYGPMGAELIPFENESDAKTFYMDHQGKKIVLFKDITPKDVFKLDE